MRLTKKQKREQFIKKRKEAVHSNKPDKILQISFFIAMSLGVWANIIYDSTLIKTDCIITAAIAGSIVAYYFINYRLKSSYSNFWLIILSIAIGAGSLNFGFLFLNKVFAEKKQTIHLFNIIESGNLGRSRNNKCSRPYAVVDFNGIEKQLKFDCEFETTIKQFTKVELEYSTGLFGFEVIVSKKLIE